MEVVGVNIKKIKKKILERKEWDKTKVANET